MTRTTQEKISTKTTSFRSSNSDSGFLDTSIEDSLLLSSEQERQSLKELNNRLANYVEYNKRQEACSNTLKSVAEVSDIPEIQLANLRQLFEDEIKGLRDALDQQSNDTAKLRISHDKILAENHNLKIELSDNSRIVDRLTENLQVSKSENEKLRVQISSFDNLKKKELDLSAQLKECQKQLEMEVLLRTSADNACLTYKEKMEFNEAVFKKELGALLVTHKNAIRKLAALQNNLSSSNILEQMEEVRRKLMDYLSELRLSIEDDLLRRIDTASSRVSQTIDNQKSIYKESADLTNENSSLLIELAKIRASHEKLENQLSDLGSIHQDEIDRLQRTISDISSSQIDEFEERMRSLQDLNKSLSAKAQLDSEIVLYRKLIESEEDRTGHRSDSQSPEIKRRKVNPVTQSQQSSPKSAHLNGGRPILRASKHNKTCSIM